MFMNTQPNIVEYQIKAYQEERMEEARLYRLSKVIIENRPAFWQYSAWHLGDFLTRTGYWLQEHARPARPLAYR